MSRRWPKGRRWCRNGLAHPHSGGCYSLRFSRQAAEMRAAGWGAKTGRCRKCWENKTLQQSERWLSGRKRGFAKPVASQGARRFESCPLRLPTPLATSLQVAFRCASRFIALYYFDSSRNDDTKAAATGAVMPPKESIRNLLAVMKALADENRLRIVAALDRRELCLCQIVELLGLATSTVSRHASILQHARLIRSRKQGRWTYFRLDDEAPAAAQDTAVLLIRELDDDHRVQEDRKRLTQILKTDPEELCRKQSECKC